MRRGFERGDDYGGPSGRPIFSGVDDPSVAKACCVPSRINRAEAFFWSGFYFGGVQVADDLHGGFPFRSSEGEAVDCLASVGELVGVGHIGWGQIQAYVRLAYKAILH